MSTSGSYIDVKNAKLSRDVGDDHVKSNWFKDFKFSSISNECNRIDVVDNLVRKKDTN